MRVQGLRLALHLRLLQLFALGALLVGGRRLLRFDLLGSLLHLHDVGSAGIDRGRRGSRYRPGRGIRTRWRETRRNAELEVGLFARLLAIGFGRCLVE